MRAWQVHELGDPKSALVLEEVEEPKPSSGEVIVEVEAAALNFFDILLCRGEYQERPSLPFTPGAEVSGTVVEVGRGVDLAAGTRGLAAPPLPKGGFTEKVAVPASGAVFPVPDAIPFEVAAAMHLTYQTAFFGLHRRGEPRARGEVLVGGGGGGGGGAGGPT